MGLYYHSLMTKVKEDFQKSGEIDFEVFLLKNQEKYLKEFITGETWFAFNMYELSQELGVKTPHYERIALDFINQNREDWSSAPLGWPGSPSQEKDDSILGKKPSEAEAYTKLDKTFKRFKIERTEMIEITHSVTGVIYNGMGDFSEFKGEGKTLAEAVENVFKEYVLFYGIRRDDFKKGLK